MKKNIAVKTLIYIKIEDEHNLINVSDVSSFLSNNLCCNKVKCEHYDNGYRWYGEIDNTDNFETSIDIANSLIKTANKIVPFLNKIQNNRYEVKVAIEDVCGKVHSIEFKLI